MATCEALIAGFEAADAAMRSSGQQQARFGDANAKVLEVTGGCHGCLFEQLLKASGYRDVACVELLRKGLRLVFL